MAYNPKTGKGLGRFYDANHRAFRAREWRGFRDTFYDFFPLALSLRLHGRKAGLSPHPHGKAMMRYRWMVSYLTAAHMVDRHTMGLRGKELRYAHNQFFSVLHNSVLGVRDIIVRDENLRPNSKRAAKLRENTVMFDEMTPHLIMMGFPTVKWIDIAMFAIGLPSRWIRTPVCTTSTLWSTWVCRPMSARNRLPKAAAPLWMTIPGWASAILPAPCPATARISQTNIMTRHFKDLPSFQITRHSG